MKPTAHSDLLSTRLKETGIFGLAEQIGGELPHRRGAYTALRNSVRDDELGPGIYEREDGAFRESHRRGEILVAAVLNAFVSVWARRALIGFEASDMLCDRSRLVEEGVDAASELLTMAIRALDYMPPVHILFTDFLSAILTADGDLRPDDSRYHLRNELRRWFKYYGIVPGGGDPVPSQGGPTRRFAGTVPIEEGFWAPVGELPITYHGAHFEPLARDPNEVFRFIWENQQTLKLKGNLNDASFMKVLWVRPCVRTAPDGFVIQNTVSEFYQSVHLRAGELKTYDIRKPTGMPDSTEVRLYGGGTLIFDEFGRLKYYIHNSLDNSNRQNKRLEELWMRGAFRRGSAFNDLNEVHRMHMVDSRTAEEVW